MFVSTQQLSQQIIQKAGPVLIFGLGMTGQALVEFFENKGVSYYIGDDQKGLSCQRTHCLGCLSFDLTAPISLPDGLLAVFPSPGIPPTHRVLMAAIARGIPMVGDLEWASFFLSGTFIGVTGTNGKSTTVRLIHELLEKAGVTSALKGNIGAPLITAVSEEPKTCYVVEESSFQLELVGSLRHHIAICLNVTDDHFERYQNLDDYARAKAGIVKNSCRDDYFIYNDDDEYCRRMAQMSPAHAIPFSLTRSLTTGAFVRGNDLVIQWASQQYVFSLNECSLKGLHNQENMLVALMAVLLIKNDAAAIASYRNTLKDFVGLPHRLEKILSHRGVNYYDDSKATNVGSVVMALSSFEKNIILVAGGRDKMGDYTPLKELVKNKVKKMILLGEAKETIEKALWGTTTIEKVNTMKDAVCVAVSSSVSGDVVLLSPACSSYDQYKNYKERGDDFKKCVLELCRQRD